MNIIFSVEKIEEIDSEETKNMIDEILENAAKVPEMTAPATPKQSRSKFRNSYLSHIMCYIITEIVFRLFVYLNLFTNQKSLPGASHSVPESRRMYYFLIKYN